MRKISHTFFVYIFALAVLFTSNIVNAESTLLTPEENLWLKSRNNTIVVYPRKNSPPFSYENTAGTPQGLSVDYIELIAQKVGAKVEYLQSRPLSQILDDVKQGKGDVIASITDTKDREEYLYFTDNFVAVPAVIVVRKDYDNGNMRNINDLVGKKVAIIDKSALEEFVRKNNPRIIIESMTDDEISLQQVVLGEVDAAVMDIASLSFYLSKQVLNAVKVSGNIGYEYKLSFGIPKDKEILQSILDKGLQQISTNDRQILNDKWITVPGMENNGDPSTLAKVQDFLGPGTIYILFTLGVAAIVIAILQRRRYPFPHLGRRGGISELKEEIAELEDASQGLVEELHNIKTLEENIQNRIKNIDLK
ncbi:MAG: transporter substrate-binding domain-containing protein [Patescibacteria group bacterium]